MKFFKSNSKIEFVSLYPEMDKLMPIEPASNIKRQWIIDSSRDYKKQLEDYKFDKKITNISKCPGIADINKNGWILRAYQDFTIETNGDGYSFNWFAPINQSKIATGHDLNESYIGSHDNDLKHFITDDMNILQTVIKVQSQWIVYIPKNYYLLQMPIPYLNNKHFTAAPGILDSDFGPAKLNVLLFWHTLNDKVMIPAGTPLCQYILVKKEKVNTIIRSSNKKDIRNMTLKHYIMDSKFISNAKSLKNIIWNKE